MLAAIQIQFLHQCTRCSFIKGFHCFYFAFLCNNIESKHCKTVKQYWLRAQYSWINSIFESLLRYYRSMMSLPFISHLLQFDVSFFVFSFLSSCCRIVLFSRSAYHDSSSPLFRKFEFEFNDSNKRTTEQKKIARIWIKSTLHHLMYLQFNHFTSTFSRNIIFDQTKILHSDSISWMQFSVLFALPMPIAQCIEKYSDFIYRCSMWMRYLQFGVRLDENEIPNDSVNLLQTTIATFPFTFAPWIHCQTNTFAISAFFYHVWIEIFRFECNFLCPTDDEIGFSI